ncbi:MAG TPA: ATP-binding cassette domain-containing protein, partial [Kofleriaceae bacterium]
EIAGAEPQRIVASGLLQVPEGRKIFPNLTVRENVLMGAFTRSDKAEIDTDYARMMTLFPRLAERSNQAAGTLSGGEQQMVAIARGLMAAPRLLLLDEPSLGLAPKITEEVFARVQDIRTRGVTVLLVEQNVVDGLGISDRGYVVEHGRVVMSGAAADLLRDEKIRAAYLGL